MAITSILRYLRLKIIVTLLRCVVRWRQGPFLIPPAPLRRKLVQIPSREAGRVIDAWLYYPDDPALINWHGSGFVFPSLSIDHEYCSQIAQKAGIFVLDADYRKSPEHPYPAPVEDVEDVLAWVGEQSTFIDASRLAVSGFSAGAVLAFVAASVLRSSYPKLNIRAALGVYPGTDLATDPQTRIIPAPVQPIPPKVLDIFLTRTRR
ncbi:unnamed protein product [Parascedosporium putredinis]|uniref:Alpha/beta hydrolase fold-3 domain-containing protein n=1 Tax=Parascedosporium putredinis TaxID=1442378 RepID=A0A9P1M960_9PEZI|nr:unnamed protein product [Parascedosporium putredinis]CAI7991383.1 unnamed protein product [Parascedosporium putredinis]